LDRYRELSHCLRLVFQRLPIRGKGRLADVVLSNMDGEFECHPLPGVTVSVRANQQIERWMWAGAYETELVSLLKKTLKPGMTFLDLGANIGYFSVIAAALVKDSGQVHAFEPMPQNLDRLRKNLAPFRWATAQPYAVGNVTGGGSDLLQRKKRLAGRRSTTSTG
jgi:hypothetical protein